MAEIIERRYGSVLISMLDFQWNGRRSHSQWFKASLASALFKEAAWLSGKAAGLEIQRSWV